MAQEQQQQPGRERITITVRPACKGCGNRVTVLEQYYGSQALSLPTDLVRICRTCGYRRLEGMGVSDD